MTNQDGAALIAAERQRQIEEEGHGPITDDLLIRGQLRRAAECYLAFGIGGHGCGGYNDPAPLAWPWHRGSWKPHSQIRDLTRAGALIAAEIDRLLRKDGILASDSDTARTPTPHPEEPRSGVSKGEGPGRPKLRRPAPRLAGE